MNVDRVVEFAVDGEPVAKARPRHRIAQMANGKNFVASYQPKHSVNFETRVAYSYRQRHSGPPHCGPVKLKVFAHFAIPKSWPKWKKSLARDDHYDMMPVTKKPDMDNLLKAICDGLNKVAFADDSQVFAIICSKMYSDTPRTYVKVIAYEEPTRP